MSPPPRTAPARARPVPASTMRRATRGPASGRRRRGDAPPASDPWCGARARRRLRATRGRRRRSQGGRRRRLDLFGKPKAAPRARPAPRAPAPAPAPASDPADGSGDAAASTAVVPAPASGAPRAGRRDDLADATRRRQGAGAKIARAQALGAADGLPPCGRSSTSATPASSMRTSRSHLTMQTKRGEPLPKTLPPDACRPRTAERVVLLNYSVFTRVTPMSWTPLSRCQGALHPPPPASPPAPPLSASGRQLPSSRPRRAATPAARPRPQSRRRRRRRRGSARTNIRSPEPTTDSPARASTH